MATPGQAMTARETFLSTVLLLAAAGAGLLGWLWRQAEYRGAEAADRLELEHRFAEDLRGEVRNARAAWEAKEDEAWRSAARAAEMERQLEKARGKGKELVAAQQQNVLALEEYLKSAGESLARERNNAGKMGEQLAAAQRKAKELDGQLKNAAETHKKLVAAQQKVKELQEQLNTVQAALTQERNNGGEKGMLLAAAQKKTTELEGQLTQVQESLRQANGALKLLEQKVKDLEKQSGGPPSDAKGPAVACLGRLWVAIWPDGTARTWDPTDSRPKQGGQPGAAFVKQAEEAYKESRRKAENQLTEALLAKSIDLARKKYGEGTILPLRGRGGPRAVGTPGLTIARDRIAFLGQDGTVSMWNAGGELWRDGLRPQGPVLALAVDDKFETLGCLTEQGLVTLEAATGKPVSTFKK
jgi:hypothetical protein